MTANIGAFNIVEHLFIDAKDSIFLNFTEELYYFNCNYSFIFAIFASIVEKIL